jgi:hypothetical protein
MMFDLETVRSWWRNPHGGALQGCDPREVERIAADLGVSEWQLRQLARGDRGRRALLLGMMAARDVDPATLDMPVMRSMEVSCSNCEAHRRCARELRRGTAVANAAAFCANAETFDALASETAATAPAAL